MDALPHVVITPAGDCLTVQLPAASVGLGPLRSGGAGCCRGSDTSSAVVSATTCGCGCGGTAATCSSVTSQRHSTTCGGATEGGSGGTAAQPDESGMWDSGSGAVVVEGDVRVTVSV